MKLDAGTVQGEGLGVILKKKLKLLFHSTFYPKTDCFIFYRKFATRKVKLVFFFSFVLASAALVQHRAKLPLLNKFDGLENSCCCSMCFFREKFSL